VECQWLTGLLAGDGLQIFRRLNQCKSDGLALNWLVLVRNGCDLQVYMFLHYPVKYQYSVFTNTKTAVMAMTEVIAMTELSKGLYQILA